MRILVILLILLCSNLHGQSTGEFEITRLNDSAFYYLDRGGDSLCYFAGKAYTANSGRYEIEEVRSFLVLGICLRNDGKLDSAFQLFDAARATFDEHDMLPELGRANWYLGKIWWALRKMDKAEEVYLDAVSILEEAGDYDTQFKVLNGLGVMRISQGDYSKALQYLKQSLTVVERENLFDFHVRVLKNISGVYVELKEYEKALEFNQLAIDNANPERDKDMIPINYLDRALIYDKTGNRDSSDFFMDQALQAARRVNFSQRSIRYQMSKLHSSRGEYTEAIPHLKYIIDSTRMNAMSDLIYFDIAEKYYLVGKLDSALYYAHLLNQLSVDSNGKTNIYKSAKLLSEIYSDRQNMERSNYFLKQYAAYKDSVFNDELNQQVSDLRVQIETIDKANQIEQLKTQVTIEELTRKSLIRTSIGIFLILVFFIILISIRYNHQRKLEKIKQRELIRENKRNRQDLHLQTLRMMRLSSTMLDVEESIKELKRVTKDEKIGLQRILNIIRVNKSVESEWESFNHHFNSIYSGFTDYLKKNYPELTINEIRFCSLMKMDLKNNEIASILGIASRSVIMSKYRIKKKMKVDDQVRIEDFIKRLDSRQTR